MPNRIRDVNQLDSWRRNVIVLFTIPLILLGCIYISYGEFIDAILANLNLPATSIFELNTHLQIFQNDSLPPGPPERLPEIVRVIGYTSAKAICLLLLLWLLGFSISGYIKLSHRKGSKVLILFELLLMVTIFTFSVQPEIPKLITISGYIVFTFLCIILALYWIEGIKNKR